MPWAYSESYKTVWRKKDWFFSRLTYYDQGEVGSKIKKTWIKIQRNTNILEDPV